MRRQLRVSPVSSADERMAAGGPRPLPEVSASSIRYSHTDDDPPECGPLAGQDGQIVRLSEAKSMLTGQKNESSRPPASNRKYPLSDRRPKNLMTSRRDEKQSICPSPACEPKYSSETILVSGKLGYPLTAYKSNSLDVPNVVMTYDDFGPAILVVDTVRPFDSGATKDRSRQGH